MAEGTSARRASGTPVISFEAQVQRTGGSTVLRLPGDASAGLPSRGQVAVNGVINGQAFQTVVEPDGKRGHWLKVDKKMRQALGVSEGNTVALEIEPVKEWPEPDIPEDFQAALVGAPDICEVWKSITPMARWEWVRWINATKNRQTRGHFNIISLRSSTHRELSMRNDMAPFTSKYVRQAIACTLDRPPIVRALFRDYAQIGNDSPFAPVFAATVTSVAQRVRNIALARRLLAKAGFPNGFSARLVTETTAEMPDLAQIIVASAKRIGVDITLTVETPAKFFGQATFGNPDWLDGEMSLVDYGGRSVPNIFLQAPLQTINPRTGRGAWNAARFSNPSYDVLSKQFIAALDLSSQRRIAGQIETLMLDQTPIIYPYFCDLLSATSKNITGVYPTGIGDLFLYNAGTT